LRRWFVLRRGCLRDLCFCDGLLQVIETRLSLGHDALLPGLSLDQHGPCSGMGPREPYGFTFPIRTVFTPREACPRNFGTVRFLVQRQHCLPSLTAPGQSYPGSGRIRDDARPVDGIGASILGSTIFFCRRGRQPSALTRSHFPVGQVLWPADPDWAPHLGGLGALDFWKSSMRHPALSRDREHRKPLPRA